MDSFESSISKASCKPLWIVHTSSRWSNCIIYVMLQLWSAVSCPVIQPNLLYNHILYNLCNEEMFVYVVICHYSGHVDETQKVLNWLAIWFWKVEGMGKMEDILIVLDAVGLYVVCQIPGCLYPKNVQRWMEFARRSETSRLARD